MIEPATTIRSAVAADFASASIGRRLALIGVVAWLAYEWGPGNESVTPWLLATVIGRSDGVLVIPVTAAFGFAFTTLQQLASGYTALAGFSVFERTSHAAWNRLRGSAPTGTGEWTTLSLFARCAMVFALGTTAVALVQITTTGVVGVRPHARAVHQAALLCGVLVGLIGAAAATVAHIGRQFSALAGATDWVLRILGNPIFWLAVLVLPLAAQAILRAPRRDGSRTGQT